MFNARQREKVKNENSFVTSFSKVKTTNHCGKSALSFYPKNDSIFYERDISFFKLPQCGFLEARTCNTVSLLTDVYFIVRTKLIPQYSTYIPFSLYMNYTIGLKFALSNDKSR